MTTAVAAKSPPELTPLKQAYLALERARAKIKSLEAGPRDPIAIIGIGCRFPGSSANADEFWRLLRGGVDAVTEVPKSRWDNDEHYDPDPDVPRKIATRFGAFIDNVDQFDPEFFGISPREAATIDPQQRLLLETSWEAIERAGIAPASLYRSPTGVFLGICNQDYASLITEVRGEIQAYLGTGNSLSAAAGRLSYLLGLQGPSLIVDTACSSSLVALHLACQSLRNRECNLALTGGANLMLTPVTSAIFSKSRMLAPDGRCKTFDAAADGYVRGEGIGVILLKRLSEAIADQDPIVAVIRGSAVNQDGPSSGLTVPNGPAQQDVIRRALANAQVTADEMTYIEAHGTGTSLGDPIEMGALGGVFGSVRTQADPLYVGSVKTNIGHLEGSAGVAAIIKAALMLQHGELPAHLHFQKPSPHIDWARLPVKVVTQRQAWPAHRPRLAGVSSFGFSGTNAHIILEAAPPKPAATPAEPAAPSRATELITLSAKTEASLKELAGRMGEHLEKNPQLPLADVALTLNAGRNEFQERLTVIAGSTAAAAALFSGWSRGEVGLGIKSGKVGKGATKAAFLFSAQNRADASQAAILYQTQPAFRTALDECAACMQVQFDRILNDVLFVKPQGPATAESDVGDWLATFALEYALARLWQSWGVAPASVWGQGIGEYAAATVAAVSSVADGMQLVAARHRFASEQRAEFGLLSVASGEQQVAELLRSTGSNASLAAINSAEEVLVSGSPDSLKQFADACRQRGWVTMPVATEDAFSNAISESSLAEFRAVAEKITFAAPRLPIISSATGERVGPEIATAEYWINLPRQPTRFQAGMKTLLGSGVGVMLEMGRRPTLSMLGQRSLRPADSETAPAWLPSLRPDTPAWTTLLEALSELYLRGGSIHWKQVASGQNARRCALPTYAFQRESYWFEAPPTAVGSGARGLPTGHPLLGDRLQSAAEEAQFTAELGPNHPRFLADHRFGGVAILPATAYLEIARAAGEQTLSGEESALEIQDVSIERPLALPPNQTQLVQTILQPLEDGSQRFRLFSLDAADASANSEWKLHASANVRRSSATRPADISRADLENKCAEPVDVAKLYSSFKSVGLEYGPLFQGLQRAWRGAGQVLAEVTLPAELRGTAQPYRLHPVVLDGCLQALAASAELSGAYLPVSIGRLTVFESLPEHVWCHVTLRPEDAEGVNRLADFRIFTEDGRVLAVIEQLGLRRIAQPAATSASTNGAAAGILPPRSTSRFAPSEAAAKTAQEIRDAVGSERAALVVRFLQEELASILKRASKGLPSPDKTFLELGMDSLMGLEMVYRIQNGLGLTLSEQTMLHFATIQQLADELTQRLEAKAAGEPEPEVDTGASVLSSAFFAAPTSAGGTPWLRIVRPNPSAAVRLFCFPNLGGGASLFDRWVEDLPEQVELCGIQLPGREDRLQEPPITDFSELTEALIDALMEHLDRPFAFFGHSGGSLVAYETARLVSSRLNLTPLFLGVGALWAPHLSKERAKSAGQAGLVKLLELAQPAQSNGQAAANPQAVISDLELFGSYRFSEKAALDCPIIACGGEEDGLVSAEDLASWKDYTTTGFTQQVVAGNHESYLEQRKIWLAPMLEMMMYDVA